VAVRPFRRGMLTACRMASQSRLQSQPQCAFPVTHRPAAVLARGLAHD
jgi:hypothetical protein